ncbi:MAG: TRZ/ATZ family protein [Planctomycetota bacterium]|nr:MAG: TRZ/ATZ family protein [Planctomycetota bacterium]RKY13523.1 MAG: TRZ/ATZ family protein [Planctomycetota bacterium]
MNHKKQIKTPLDDAVVWQLRAGDEVLISGKVLTGRDQAHKRLCERIAQGGPLPVELAGMLIYFVGPTPAAPGQVIGAAGPTTSSRMDAFTPQLLAQGLKGTIGKGYRGQSVRDALVKNRAVHFSALGGAGALLSKHIIKSQIVAYEDLGTEAIRLLEFEDFPVVVAYDCRGNSVYGKEKNRTPVT